MSKSLEYNDDKWYFSEVVPLEHVIKNMATNQTFKLETVSALPKISFIARFKNLPMSAINTYKQIKVESQLSSDHKYWETKIWVFTGSQNPELDPLTIAVLSEESPDAQFMIDFSDISNVLALSQHAAEAVALRKVYSKCVPQALRSRIEISSIKQARRNNEFKFPTILISLDLIGKESIIDIEIDISNGTFLLHNINLDSKIQNIEHSPLLIKQNEILPLPPKWRAKRESLMGANSNPDSLAVGLRISEFLGDNDQWCNPELITDALSKLEKELIRLK